MGNTAPESGLPHVASISQAFAHLLWHRLLWIAKYCGYEGLVDVRRALNVTREAGRIRNDLTVGPVSTASIVVNCHFVQFALSLACAMKKLQPRYEVILWKLKSFCRKEIKVWETYYSKKIGEESCIVVIKSKSLTISRTGGKMAWEWILNINAQAFETFSKNSS